MPVSGGTTRKFPNARCPQRRKAYRSRFRSNSSSTLAPNAAEVPKTSTCTEWSITRSAGWSGLIRFGSPPMRRTASRIAARSPTAGTPVKSCKTTRAGSRGILRLPVTLLTLLALVQPVRAGTPEPGFSDTLYADGLSEPTALAFLPDGRLLITQKSGELLLLDSGSTSTLVTIPVCTDSEMGLLGIALDPAFGSNGFIYLYRTHPGSSPP